MYMNGLSSFIVCMVLTVSAMLPQAGFAGGDVNIGKNVPLPAFVFSAPPAVVFIPGTYVYAVPDVDINIVFYHGYWYRPHMDYWYRSTSYNGPWKHIDKKVVPGVLFKLPPDYRQVPPGHQRIPYGQLKKNWKSWERDKYWDKHEQKHEEKRGHKEEKNKHTKGGKGKH